MIEGRARTKRATHALSSVDQEIRVMAEHFEPTLRYRECAVLTARVSA